MSIKQIKEVTVIELLKVDVTGVAGLRVIGKKVFVFDDHLEGLRWLTTLPMDSSHIDYYYKSTKVNMNDSEFNPEEPFGNIYAGYDELQGARRIKDLELVLKGIGR